MRFLAFPLFLNGCSQEGDKTIDDAVQNIQRFKDKQQYEIQQTLQILREEPNNLSALIKLGNIYYDTGEDAKAIEYYKRALEIDPNNCNVRTDMGTNYKRLGKLDDAIKEYKKSIEINPKHSPSHFNMGAVLFEKKLYEEAIQSWQKYIELEPHGQLSEAARQQIDIARSFIGYDQE